MEKSALFAISAGAFAGRNYSQEGDDLVFSGTVEPEVISTGEIAYGTPIKSLTISSPNLASFNGRWVALVEDGFVRADRAKNFSVYFGVDLQGGTRLFDVVQAGMTLTMGDTGVRNGTVRKAGAGTLSLGWKASATPNLGLVVCEGTVLSGKFSNRLGRRLCYDGNGTCVQLGVGEDTGSAGPTFTDFDLSETANVTRHDHRLTSATPGCVLTLDGTPKNSPTVFSGILDGTLGLTWAPSDPNAALVLRGGASTTTGAVTVAAGEVRLTEGACLARLSRLEVKAGARLVIEKGCWAVTSELVVNGQAVAPGRYADAAWGGGTVLVLPPASGTRRTATWVGGADARLDTAANWAGGVAPDLADGGTTVVLAPAAALPELILPDVAYLDGIDFRLAEGNGDLVLKTASSGGALFLGSAGLAFTNAAAEAKTTFRPCVVLRPGGAAPVIALGEVARDVVFEAETYFADAAFVGLTGAGRVHFMADVGGPGSALRVQTEKAHAVLHGVTWAGGFRCAGATQENGAVVVSAAGTTNTVIGAVVSERGYSQFHLNRPDMAGGGGHLVLKGGVSSPNGGVVNVNCGLYNATVSERPLQVSRVYQMQSAANELTFNVSSNVIGVNSFQMANDARILLTKPFAFWGGNNALFNGKLCQAQLEVRAGVKACVDLGGFDQELTGVSVSPAQQAAVVFASESPAQLHLAFRHPLTMGDKDAYAYTNRMQFAGAAGLTFDGADEWPWRTFQLVRESTTTGRLEVVGGRLTMAEGGSWPNAAEVRASGGTLAIAHAGAFGRSVAVRADGGTIDLPSSAVVRVGSLWVEGLGVLPPGDYGGPDCVRAGVPKPAYPSGAFVFSGPGVMRVGKVGFCLLVR